MSEFEKINDIHIEYGFNKTSVTWKYDTYEIKETVKNDFILAEYYFLLASQALNELFEQEQIITA